MEMKKKKRKQFQHISLARTLLADVTFVYFFRHSPRHKQQKKMKKKRLENICFSPKTFARTSTTSIRNK